MTVAASQRGPAGNPIAKAALVVAGPCLVTLIPMAAAPALPAMAAHFGGTGGTLLSQMVMTVSAIAITVCAPLSGIVAELVGLRACMLAMLGLFCACGTASLFVSDTTSLLAVRVGLGIAGGGLLTMSMALAGDYPEGGPRERLLGSIVACTAVLSVMCLNFGGYLVDVLGWRGPFALYLLGFPVLLVAATSLRAEQPGEVRHNHGLVEPLRAYWHVYLLVVALTIGMFMPAIQGPFLLQSEQSISAAQQGMIVSACSLAAAASAASFGWISRWLDTPRLFALIAGVYALGGLGAGFLHGLPAVAVSFGSMGIGAGLVEATAARAILANAPESLRSRAVGVLIGAIFLGQFLNPLAVNPLRETWGIRGAFTAIGVFFGLLAFALVIKGLSRQRTTTTVRAF